MCQVPGMLGRTACRILLLMGCGLLLPLAAHGVLHRTQKDASGAQTAIEVVIPAPEPDVLESVKEVSQDHIVHGTYVYEREKTLNGAHDLASSPAFDSWGEAGKVLYKEIDDVIDPRHFKESNGSGAITVRYVVQAVSPEKTRLRIDAVFTVADRRQSKASDGSVEFAEYEAIRERLQVIQQDRLQVRTQPSPRPERPPVLIPEKKPPAQATEEDALRELEQNVARLRSEVEAQVKQDGTALRSAPFAGAAVIQFIPAKTPVAILVLTPKWYGVESKDGHRGWIRRSELGEQP